MMSRRADLPFVRGTSPTYYAAILTTALSPDPGDLTGYADAAAEMAELAERIDGYLGMEFARDPACGITVSYWRDLEALRRWRDDIDHLAAQRLGRERFYLGYRARICRVEREYEWTRPPGRTRGPAADSP
ncbi:antibiotic biosynthesis monooxygenase [Nocardia sp. BMG51109]|uniref:antibiotic biosynthesis monooxygenase family protein n=1 Tax=Nocardia sp. BMG51109 TaxID=1056816 RepID=UPI0004AD96C1|nr:antibiotic biosynthesis monooxygenase [Nocardia sp. BMG51109]